jgi:hypothetical protein
VCGRGGSEAGPAVRITLSHYPCITAVCFVFYRLRADRVIVPTAGADLPPKGQEILAGGPGAPGASLPFTLASLQQSFLFMKEEDSSACAGGPGWLDSGFPALEL